MRQKEQISAERKWMEKEQSLQYTGCVLEASRALAIGDWHKKPIVAVQMCCGAQGDGPEHSQVLSKVLLSNIRLFKTVFSQLETEQSYY